MSHLDMTEDHYWIRDEPKGPRWLKYELQSIDWDKTTKKVKEVWHITKVWYQNKKAGDDGDGAPTKDDDAANLSLDKR